MGRNETASITLKILAQDLATGKVGAFVGKLDTLSKRGGIAGRMMQGVGMSMGMMQSGDAGVPCHRRRHFSHQRRYRLRR